MLCASAGGDAHVGQGGEGVHVRFASGGRARGRRRVVAAMAHMAGARCVSADGDLAGASKQQMVNDRYTQGAWRQRVAGGGRRVLDNRAGGNAEQTVWQRWATEGLAAAATCTVSRRVCGACRLAAAGC